MRFWYASGAAVLHKSIKSEKPGERQTARKGSVNDGEQAASAVIYTRREADAITFEADGQALIDVEKYDLIFE